MRVTTLMTVIAVAASTGSALAAGNPRMKACADSWKSTPPGASQTYKQFMTTCLHVGTPATAPTPIPVGPSAETAAKNPAKTSSALNATAQCKDGSYSQSAQHASACSHHGGVAKFLK